MTVPFTLSIDTLSLSLGDQTDAYEVAQSMTSTLQDLYSQDFVAGIHWQKSLDGVSLEVREGLSSQEIGRTLAHHLRDRLMIRGVAK
jgi:hypothetical protein